MLTWPVVNDLLELEVDGAIVESIDLGTCFAGTKTQTAITATNVSDSALTNVTVTCVDKIDSTTAKKTVFGGNEMSENVAESYLYGSLDGVTWYELAGLNKYLVCIEEGDTLAIGESFTFFLKVELPANALINFQNIALYFRAE